MKPFEKQPGRTWRRSIKKKIWKSLAPILKTEYEEMDTEEEESEVRKLTKEELEMYQQYKEFYTIQGRTKGKIPGF